MMEDMMETMMIKDDRLNKLQDIVEKSITVSSNNAKTTAEMLVQLEAQGQLLAGLSKRVSNFTDDMRVLTDDVEVLKEHAEIDTLQADKLKSLIRSRITNILGYGSYDYYVYFGMFARRLRSDAVKQLGVPYKIDTLRKRDYQRYIDFVEAWYPSGGATKLKESLDNMLIIRKNKKKYEYLLTA